MEWIIWSSLTESALIIIPEEAELVIPIVRSHAGASRDNPPTATLIAYAAPVAKAMRVFNSLCYYSVPALPVNHPFPAWFRVELGVLAGRLYADFTECGTLASFLHPPGTTDSYTEDLSELPTASQVRYTFVADNPAGFLLEWLSTRRGGQDVLQTPVGHVCTGRALREDHPFFL